MSGFEWSPGLLFAIGALVLVLSALSGRGMGFFSMLRMVIGWLVIFAGIFLIFSYRYELEPVWERVRGELMGDTTPVVTGEEVRIRLGLDNHFSVRAQVNGEPVDMLIDSGATFTAMGSDTARRLGVRVDMNTFPRIVQTANGSIRAYPGKIDTLEVGSIRRDNVTVFVAPEFGDFAVIGMNFLSSLSGWRVENNEMIMRP